MSLDPSLIEKLFGTATTPSQPTDMTPYRIQPDIPPLQRTMDNLRGQGDANQLLDSQNSMPGFFGVDRRLLANLGASVARSGMTPGASPGLGIAEGVMGYQNQRGADAKMIYERAAQQAAAEAQQRNEMNKLNTMLNREDLKDQTLMKREDIKTARQFVLDQLNQDKAMDLLKMKGDQALNLQLMKGKSSKIEDVYKQKLFDIDSAIGAARTSGDDETVKRLMLTKQETANNLQQILGKKTASVNAIGQQNGNYGAWAPEDFVQSTGDPVKDRAAMSAVTAANSTFAKLAASQKGYADNLIGSLGQMKEQFFPQDAKDAILYLQKQRETENDPERKATIQQQINQIKTEKIAPLGNINDKAGMFGAEMSNFARATGNQSLADKIANTAASDQVAMLNHLQAIITEQGIGAYRVPGQGRFTNAQLDLIKQSIPNTKNMTPQALDMGIELLTDKMKLLREYLTNKSEFLQNGGKEGAFDKKFAEYSALRDKQLTQKLNVIKQFYKDVESK